MPKQKSQYRTVRRAKAKKVTSKSPTPGVILPIDPVETHSVQPVGPVPVVEGVEADISKPIYDWHLDAPFDVNFRHVGAALSKLVPNLYQHPDGGLILVKDGRPQHIKSAKQLSPFLIDTINIRVWKETGKRAGRLSQSVLDDMLNCQSFLDNFKGARAAGRKAKVANAKYQGCEQQESRTTAHNRTGFSLKII